MPSTWRQRDEPKPCVRADGRERTSLACDALLATLVSRRSTRALGLERNIVARSTKQPPTIGAPEVDAARGIQLLKQQIDKARALLAGGRLTSDDYDQWELLTRNFLEKAFAKNSPNVTAVTSVGRYGAFPMDAGEEWWHRHRVESLQTQVKKLEGLIELLQTEQQLAEPAPEIPKRPIGHRIFLVHGHDERVLHEVARFLERLKQEVIVLREQPSAGRTIIEKFVDYSDVGYAVVLLTPDDRGATANTPFEQQHGRARQNVIFELGYFIGKLGRNRVTALYVPGVEVPSDYSGVAFVAFDDRGAWRLELAREFRAAGLSVDMNLAL